MKVNLDLKKGAAAVTGAFQKTGELTKKVSDDVQKRRKDLSEKRKDENYQKRLKKYNPLFPDEYFSETFSLPNMIEVVDDAVRKDIDVCEGAIGWISTHNGMEVLHLYDEFVPECNINFIPVATCDTFYFVDKFDRSRFLQLDTLFSKAHDERLAELKNIAYMLGAKKCSIEISESTAETSKSGKKAQISGPEKTIGSSAEQSISTTNSAHRSGRVELEFCGSDEVKVPTLKWFEHDDTIKNLIKMRTENKNSIKVETLVLEGAVSATMSQKTALSIDAAIKGINAKAKSSIENQATKENQSKLLFHIEF